MTWRPVSPTCTATGCSGPTPPPSAWSWACSSARGRAWTGPRSPSAPDRPPRPPRRSARLVGEEGAEALVLLAAGLAAGQVGADAGQAGVGVLAGQLQLDVAVQLGEAVVAAHLRILGAQQ